MKPWTTDSVPAEMRLHYRRSAIGSVQPRCKALSGVGPGVCNRPSLRPTSGPDTGIKWPCRLEISDTCVLDRPQAGRMWFERVIRDHLDVDRTDQIALIFHRRVSCRTPGRFRTRVINWGVDPTLCCYYKFSRIKQYFKEGPALRTETVICDTGDSGVGRRAQNWNALRAVGESANRCLCDAEAADARPAPDVANFCQVTRPSINDDGLYAAGLRFGEQRVMAILAALVGFCSVARRRAAMAIFTNRQLVERAGALLHAPYSGRQATYDLRRLKRKGLIAKVARTKRYQLTRLSRRVAVLFTKTYGRVLAPGLKRARSPSA